MAEMADFAASQLGLPGRFQQLIEELVAEHAPCLDRIHCLETLWSKFLWAFSPTWKIHPFRKLSCVFFLLPVLLLLLKSWALVLEPAVSLSDVGLCVGP